jgi:uncharacterized protein
MIMQTFAPALGGGILIGVASWLMLAGLGRVTGISGIVSGAMGEPVRTPVWRWAFLAGLVGGGALAVMWFPVPLHASRSPALLGLAGLLVGFGTVLGSGCTSGHGVCGLGRRSLRSLVAVLVFMTTGFLTVTVLRGVA